MKITSSTNTIIVGVLVIDQYSYNFENDIKNQLLLTIYPYCLRTTPPLISNRMELMPCLCVLMFFGFCRENTIIY